ncbi:hypothetical protein [Chitinimonas koreensis]|nr:hypothetical protein [Chitinimonas koreensis]QNM96188.1 hypothetical protein H9L41_20645 [Chitinimonas koreensis]
MWVFLAGLYLIAGGGYSLFTGEWFAGFPLQFDLLEAILPAKFGIYTEALVAILMGLSISVLPFITKKTNTDDDRTEEN